MGSRPLGMLLVVLVAIVGGCGGDDAGSTTTSAAAETTTTAGGATTTVVATTTPGARLPVPSADPAAVSRAERGLLTPADLGAGWVQFEAGAGVLRDVRPTSRIGCALPPAASLAPSTLTAVVDGAIAQRGTAKRYVTSAALGFTDDAAATAAVDAFRSPAWSACRAGAKTADAKAQPGGATDPRWRADPVDDERRGEGGFEGVVRLQYQAVVDGKLQDANGFESVFLYRVGRTVLVVAAEGLDEAADPPNLGSTVSAELSAAVTKAVARLR